MTHAEKAAELFRKGYNCSQSIFCAFCDVTGMDEKTALMLSSPFGGGMGRLRQACGACTGAFMVAGVLFGYSDTNDNIAKKETYALVQDIANRFKERNETIMCNELLKNLKPDTSPTPTPRSELYYKQRPCVRFVIDAADILDDIIKERSAEK